MAYTYDADLEFLGECTDEQLKDLADILIYDKEYKTRYLEEITTSEEYKKFGTKYSKYWKVLAGDLQKFGGDTFVNSFIRFGRGVKYDEILSDVLRQLKIPFDKSSSIITRENSLIEKMFEDMLKSIPEIERKEIIDVLGIEVKNYDSPLIMLAIKKAILSGNYLTYQISLLVANHISRLILKKGLTIATKTRLSRGLSILAGSIGWAVTGVWTIKDISNAAMRVTIPATIIIAYLRKSILMNKEK